MPRGRRRLLTAVVVALLVGGFVSVLYQRPVAQWGSTAAERTSPMAGDGVVAHADSQWTRSITIDAPPDRVWPWLVQIGVDKAGFYNYDWGEQIAGLDPVHNATTIHPEWQDLRPGDVVHPMPSADWRVVTADTDRALVLDNPAVSPTDWSWATELRPLGTDRTRLVTRIRSHKGSLFSYVLDVPDLILFPRLLTGVKQRAEGTLPGMPGTHTGRPFPLARLPVHWWASALWLAGLAIVAGAIGGTVGFGRWGRRRPHPWITLGAGFVTATGYLLMSDTPPAHFVRQVWGLGLVAGAAVGLGLWKRQVAVAVDDADHRTARWFPRAVVALVETSVFVVLPVTAVWQAATAQGWTASLGGRLLVSAVAAAAATGIAGPAWSRARGAAGAVAIAAPLALAYAVTGSGLAALLAALVVETARSRGADVAPAVEPEAPPLPADLVDA